MELIEEKLDEAGYKLLGSEKSIEQLIIDILETKNTRYLKAIPFLLYKHDADTKAIYSKTKQQKLFGEILSITNKIFTEFNIGKQVQMFGSASSNLNYAEFKDEFDIQLRCEKKPNLLIDRQKIDAERNLQFWLSQIFSKKEKIIMKRILEEKPISKTDYEYYSRKAKKKLKAILDLDDFARALIEKKPKYNEDLFFLKKQLEKFIEDRFSYTEVSIQTYYTFEDSISIIFKKKEDTYSEDQLRNTIIKLKEIKDAKIISLLKQYKNEDFA